MDVQDPVLVAAGIFLVYLLVVGSLWRINRVDYMRLAESSATVTRGIVVPIGVGLAVLAVATTVLGWWPDVLTQPRTGPAWTLVVPALFLLVSVVSCLNVDYSGLGSRRVLVLAAGALVVGVSEELLSRGVLVVGPQQAEWSPVWVWLFSSVLFALLHAINALFGLPWHGMLAQLVMSFFGGTALFVTLMSTGSLLAGVVLHALWDFGALAQQATGRTPPRTVTAGIALVYLFGLGAALLTTV